MYIRRKVFSLSSRLDAINELYQRLYSDDDKEKKKSGNDIVPYIVGGAIGTGAGVGSGYYLSRDNRAKIKQAKEKIEKYKGRDPEKTKQNYISSKQKERADKLAEEKTRHEGVFDNKGQEKYRTDYIDSQKSEGASKILAEQDRHQKEVFRNGGYEGGAGTPELEAEYKNHEKTNKDLHQHYADESIDSRINEKIDAENSLHEANNRRINDQYSDKNISEKAAKRAEKYNKLTQNAIENRENFIKHHEGIKSFKHKVAGSAGMAAGISLAALYNGVRARRKRED